VQVARLLRGLAELAAQPRQVDVDGLVRAAVGQLPDLGEQLAFAHDAAGAGGEVVQQVELAGRQLQGTAVDAGLPRARVDPQAADDDLGVRGTLAGPAPQDGADPGVELGGAEGLDDVVVGARVEHRDDLGLVVTGRGDDDRDPADPAEHPQRRGAVDVGHPRSSTTTSGRCPTACSSPASPVGAEATAWPRSVSPRTSAVRIVGSSSTTRTWATPRTIGHPVAAPCPLSVPLGRC
jgi:hypothetical protein